MNNIHKSSSLKTRLRFLKSPKFIFGLYILIPIVSSLIEYFKGIKQFYNIEITHYNNYVIFKNAFYNMIGNNDLYIAYPDLYYDLFKYSPTFALLFGPLAVLPDWLGLPLWNLINALTLFFAIRFFPLFKDRQKILIFWFVLLELLTSMQSSQSNGLMAGLMIMAFIAFENKNEFLAALVISFSIYIKLFGGVIILLFLFYPKKLRLIGYFILWMIILFLLPISVVSFEQLGFLYKSWLNMLLNDHTTSTGLSVMGWLQTWFGLSVSKLGLLLIGSVMLVIPFLQFKKYGNLVYRVLMLASVLIWVVIFNHKAESPTFVVAISGIAIWYFAQVKTMDNYVLLLFAFILISLSPTDMFPAFLRKNYVIPYVLKAAPAIFIWFKLQYQLLFETDKLCLVE